MILYDPENKEEWLKCRFKGLGGSDAGAVIGVNKYKTNVELWEEKTGIKKKEFISNAAIEYGKSAEKYIREMFLLDNPKYSCEYHEYRMYAQEKIPFLYATLDGELTDDFGRKGVLEIKTTTIRNSSQWSEWDNRIPDMYYAQVLHQLWATGWEYVIVRAYIRYEKDGEFRAMVKDYHINRNDVRADISALIAAEIKFWDCVRKKEKPALILPEI